MITELLDGQRSWSMERDDEGHRTYTVTHIVECDWTAGIGPATVLQTPGLPLPGAFWFFGSDVDIFATCYPTMKVTPHDEKEGEAARFWKVEQKFSTKPLKRCQDTKIEDPLLEPQKVSGGFTKAKKEAVHDRFGKMLRNASFEQIRGPQVEFDEGNATVKIEQNVSQLGLTTFSPMLNTVNDRELWGCPARTVKLTTASWERKILGSCGYYYTRNFEFEIELSQYENIPASNIGTTPTGAQKLYYDDDGVLTTTSSGNTPAYKWDRIVMDEATKCVSGKWASTTDITAGNKGWVVETTVNGQALNRDNPTHYKRYHDRHGHDATCIVLHKGTRRGEPADVDKGDVIDMLNCGRLVSCYEESNFLLLGIPTYF
jgi:hypothetical protein